MFRLGFRNVVRRGSRSLITLAAIAFGVVALLIANGFVSWILSEMRELSIRTWYGHVQIARAGYWERGAADPDAYRVEREPSLIRRIRTDPRVVVAAPRVRFSGLASRGDTTLSFLGEGVDPAAEREFGRSLIFLPGRGENLAAGQRRSTVLGQGLAANLGAELGDRIVLLTTSSSGGVNAAEADVTGIFVTANQAFDASTLRIALPLAHELLRNAGVHTWTVLLKDSDDTEAIAAEWRAQAREEGLEVRTWTQLAGDYMRTEALFSRQLGVMALVLGMLIILGIWNAMTMNVMERTSEIGTSMALGASRRTVLAQFLTEGTILGVVGAGIGLAVGIALASLLSWIGIPLPPPPGLDTPIVAAIRVDPTLAAEAFLIAVVSSVLAAIYPAWRASRMEIVDALRTAHV